MKKPAGKAGATTAPAATTDAAPVYPHPSTDELVDEFERLSLSIRKLVENEAANIAAYRKESFTFNRKPKITVYYFTQLIGERDELISRSNRSKLRIVCHEALTTDEWKKFRESHPLTAELTHTHARMIPPEVDPTKLTHQSLRRYDRYREPSSSDSHSATPPTPSKPPKPPVVPRLLSPAAATASTALPRPTAFLTAPPTTAAAAMAPASSL